MMYVCMRRLSLQSEACNAKSPHPVTVEEVDGGEPYYNLMRCDGSFYTLKVKGPFSRVDQTFKAKQCTQQNGNVVFALGTLVFSHDEATFGQLGDIIAWNHDKTHC